MIEKKKNLRTSRVVKQFLVLLLSIFLFSFAASLVQSDGMRVDIRDLTFPTQNGQWVAADLFRPKSATSEKKAPLVIVVPGFQRTKETQSGISLELARRGYVVINIDPYAQGGSSSSSHSQKSATEEGYGLIPLVEYIYNSGVMNYVDKTKISATGHSAGGNAAIRAAAHFGKQAIDGGTTSKLHSVFVSGYVLTLTEAVLANVKSNVGISYAYYDEGAYRNEEKLDGVGAPGDMRTAPEAVRLINSGLPLNAHVTEVEIGRVYGQTYNKTMRIVYNEKTLHAIQPYSFTAMANNIEFFEMVYETTSAINLGNQTWIMKEIFTLITLIAALLLIIPLSTLILKIPFFHSVKHELPNEFPPSTIGRKFISWGLLLVGVVIAALSFMPMAELSKTLFVKAAASQQTWFFPSRMNNAVMLWALLNGLVGIVIFVISYFIDRKKNGVKKEMFGLSIKIKDLLKTILAGVIIFAAFYGILQLNYYLFHVDYRFAFIGISTLKPKVLLMALMYVPIFFVFYFSNSIRINGSGRKNNSITWSETLKNSFSNIGGLLVILLIQYICFIATGTVHWTDNWLYVNMLFILIPLMFLLPIFNKLFFKLTGRSYLGPIVMSLIFVTMSLSSSVLYIPLG